MFHFGNHQIKNTLKLGTSITHSLRLFKDSLYYSSVGKLSNILLWNSLNDSFGDALQNSLWKDFNEEQS